MASQEGIIKLKGRIGDLAFYKTKDGYQARAVSGITAGRIANDPRYQRTRENNAEFGRAAKAGRFFRNCFTTLTKQLADKRVSNRLSSAMLAVVKADSVNTRGERRVLDAETEMLTGFEFNINSSLASTIRFRYLSGINKQEGVSKIELPAFSARDLIVSPEGATHFKFCAAAAELDFELEEFQLASTESPMFDVKAVAIEAQTLTCNLNTGFARPSFLLFGISFYQQVNGVDYPLSNGAFNSLALVWVQGT